MTPEHRDRLLRLHQIIGKSPSKNRPGIPALIPVSKSTWWEGVKAGRYPSPVRGLGKRITAWRSADIYRLIDSVSPGSTHD